MALARKHRWTAFAAVVLALAVGVCLLPSRFLERWTVKPAPPKPPREVGPPEYAAVYAAVSELREMFQLRNEQLASIGCSERCAEEVLKTLVRWYEANHAALRAVRKREARRELRQAMRRFNIGPRDESLIIRIRRLKRAYHEALMREHEIRQTLVAEVEKVLPYGPLEGWRVMRTNRRRIPGFVCIRGLTYWQSRALKLAHGVYNSKTAAANNEAEASAAFDAYQAVIASVLSDAQRAYLDELKRNQRKYMRAGLDASEKVLPLPEALKPGPVVLPDEMEGE